MKRQVEKDFERIQELLDELDEHGSGSDPIWIDGTEYCANDLIDLPQYMSLRQKFWFWMGQVNPPKYVFGTLIQMVKDRGGTGRHREKPEEPETCPTCGRKI